MPNKNTKENGALVDTNQQAQIFCTQCCQASHFALSQGSCALTFQLTNTDVWFTGKFSNLWKRKQLASHSYSKLEMDRSNKARYGCW